MVDYGSLVRPRRRLGVQGLVAPEKQQEYGSALQMKASIRKSRWCSPKRGQKRWRWLAEPFGTTAPETNPDNLGVFTQNLRVPGQYADSEAGLNYNYFSDYDSSIGRYVQSDPIGPLGGTNTYAYARPRSTQLVDPSGLRPLTYGEKLFLRSHFGSCLDAALSNFDVNVRTIGDTRRAPSLDNGFISFPRSYFQDGIQHRN